MVDFDWSGIKNLGFTVTDYGFVTVIKDKTGFEATFNASKLELISSENEYKFVLCTEKNIAAAVRHAYLQYITDGQEVIA